MVTGRDEFYDEQEELTSCINKKIMRIKDSWKEIDFSVVLGIVKDMFKSFSLLGIGFPIIKFEDYTCDKIYSIVFNPDNDFLVTSVSIYRDFDWYNRA